MPADRVRRAVAPSAQRAQDITQLQRTAGNQAVAALLQRRKPSTQPSPGARSGASVRLAGAVLPSDVVLDVDVERDLNRPDMCKLRLKSTPDHRFGETTALGDPLSVAFGPTVFNGEVVGVEPQFPGGSVEVRAFSLLHRLTRGPKSRTFVDKTLRQIVEDIAAGAKLTAVYEGVDTKFPRVYQHHQTDLDFLLERAARFGSAVWCEGTELHVGTPTAGAGKTLRVSKPGEGGTLRKFFARIAADSAHSSGARITGEATIDGDPDLNAGMVVTLVGQDARFDGEYYVSGVRHRYGTGGRGGGGGLTTVLTVTRAAK